MPCVQMHPNNGALPKPCRKIAPFPLVLEESYGERDISNYNIVGF